MTSAEGNHEVVQQQPDDAVEFVNGSPVNQGSQQPDDDNFTEYRRELSANSPGQSPVQAKRINQEEENKKTMIADLD